MFKAIRPLRLDKKEKLIGGIKDYCTKNGIHSAVILSCIGSLDSLQLAELIEDHSRFGEVYKDFTGPLAILSAQGSVSTFEGKLIVHLHGVFSSYHEKKAFGSHVVEGITMNTVEIFLGILEDPIKRQRDSESGPPVLITA